MKLLPVLFFVFVLIAIVSLQFLIPEKVKAERAVAATIYPIYDLTRQIAGDKFQTHLLLPPGASPHTFEPTPKTAEAINNSQVIFAVGLLDEWVYKTGDKTEVIEVNQGIDFLDSEIDFDTSFDENEVERRDEDEESKNKHDHDHEKDPHYWLNIKNTMLIAEQIAEKLSEIDPDNAAYYHANLQQYRSELAAADAEIRAIIEPLPKKNIVTFHNSLQYYANEYGLNIVAVFEEFPGQSPGPQYLARFSNLLASGSVDAAFSEPQLPVERLGVIAAEHQVPMGIIDPLGGVAGRTTYLELMRYNTFELQRTLQ